jgi:hypothetical protein
LAHRIAKRPYLPTFGGTGKYDVTRLSVSRWRINKHVFHAEQTSEISHGVGQRFSALVRFGNLGVQLAERNETKLGQWLKICRHGLKSRLPNRLEILGVFYRR